MSQILSSGMNKGGGLFMTIQRQSPGECEWKLSVYRDGERLANDDAAFQLTQFCSGWSIVEDITSASMEAEFYIF